MLTSLHYCKCKTDILSVTYTNLTNILKFVETDIPTWCYFSTCPKDTLPNFVS